MKLLLNRPDNITLCIAKCNTVSLQVIWGIIRIIKYNVDLANGEMLVRISV